jgi:hypothetical protein
MAYFKSKVTGVYFDGFKRQAIVLTFNQVADSF